MTPPANRQPDAAAADRPLWFDPLAVDEDRRRTLTRERVVAEALTLIAATGGDGLSMRALAGRLGVVPAALYRHVRDKNQLQDLVLDGVLAEIDYRIDRPAGWTEQVTILAQRLRAVLESHPGIASLLKTRDPVGPHSLALAEAFLAPLHTAALPARQAALAYSLIYDYTLGFALSSPNSLTELRSRDVTIAGALHGFLRSLPADRFPMLTILGDHTWVDSRDERYTASLTAILDGLEAAHRPL